MKTLVAGFGNLLLGDDGFGVEVVRRLSGADLPEDTEAVEVGIGGFDLVLKLKDEFDRLIIVDLVRRGGRPGTILTFQPSDRELTMQEGERIDPHFAEPSRAMKLARRLNVLPGDVTVVGCEPASCDVGIGLSAPVAQAVGRAVEIIECLSSSSKQ